MFRKHFAFSVLLAVSALLCAPAAQAIVTVGPFTGADGCRFRSIQEAITYIENYEKTLDTDEVDHYIAIAGGQVYNETFKISDAGINAQQGARIDIFGGYDETCDHPDGSETLISGGGSKVGHSDLQITGRATVYLHELTLSNASLGGSGGGISVDGSGLLDLTNVDIAGNSAGSGGGIHANGSAPGLDIVLHSGVTIENNSTSGNGAGMDLSGEIFVSAVESRAVIVNNTAGGDGGGIAFRGHGSLNLAYTQIGANSAQHGGGVYFNPDSPTAATFGDGVVIGVNTAASDGGGIYVGNGADLTVQGESVVPTIFSNNVTADGGSGGGVALFGPATMTFAGDIVGNSAGYGGGISSIAGGDSNEDVFVQLQAAASNAPVSVSANSARHDGGGIYTRAGSTFTTDGNDYIYATVCANNFVFDDNAAAEGSAIFADHDAGGVLTISWGSEVALNFSGAVVGLRGCAAPAHVCTVGTSCNEIKRNSRTGSGSDDGSAVFVQSDSDFHAWNTTVQANQGAHAFKIEGDTDADLRTLLFADNAVQGELIEMGDSGELRVQDTTFANDTVGAAHVIRAHNVTLYNSIVAESQTQTFDFAGNANGGKNIGGVLTNPADMTMLAGDTIIYGQPRFVDAAHGNYRLAPYSLGLDVGVADGSAPRDLDGSPRDIDLLQIDNVQGPRDLGAYELQFIPACSATDEIFCAGFE